MQMTVQFQGGARADAVLLRVAGIRLRVIVAGRGITEEWLCLHGQCYDEHGRPVTIESAVPVAGVDYGRLGEGANSRAAGGVRHAGV